MFSRAAPVAPLFLFLATGLYGCSGSSADVTGKVTADGKEVNAGTIILSPLAANKKVKPGSPGVADIRPDLAYSMKLESGPEGLAERAVVRFTPPAGADELQIQGRRPPLQRFGSEACRGRDQAGQQCHRHRIDLGTEIIIW